MLLAIDTATRFASVALYNDSGVVAESSWRSANNHSVELAPAIAEMMARQKLTPQDLEAVAIAKGPGSFTGLRIGMSIAKGLCLALDIPIIGIPTLDITTYAVGDPGGRVLAVLEAGRGRIGVASYRFEDGLPVAEGDVELVRASQWQVQADEPVLIAGEVSAELAERLLQQPDAENISISSLAGSVRRAGYLAELAWDRLLDEAVDDLDTLSPVYLRSPAPAAATE
ncbi:MAG: tRNA (adenosine(37)-N6)-threonylcarbamoyltransferase complex dimerization subunit type 1 TsaB [Chloroflexi bacterium]|jgi:tRNA threonylcarbamoyladenosine biosynthesis protein TsaB|nr:tRNA (adenosine(37)-N6)-threonylcarbamoyltransferase complex dimerization subunit type 1 TsaB [Chloroflexota bacterium]